MIYIRLNICYILFENEHILRAKVSPESSGYSPVSDNQRMIGSAPYIYEYHMKNNQFNRKHFYRKHFNINQVIV